MNRGLLPLVVAAYVCCAGSARSQSGQVLAIASNHLARSVSLTLRVEQQDVARRELDRVVARFGRVLHDSGSRVSIEVPPQQEAAALRAISALGEVSGRSATTSDLSGQLARAQAALRVALYSHERLLHLNATGVREGLELGQARSAAVQVVEERNLAVKELERRSSFTRISIQIDAPASERIGPPQLPFPWLETLGPKMLHDPSSVEGRGRRELRNYFDGAFRLEGMHADQAGALPKNLNVVQTALNMRVLGEATPVGIFGGVDAALGGGSGFSYELQLMIGLGVPIGQRLGIGVSSGPGVEGVTSTVPLGVTFPIELHVSWDMSRLFSTKLALRNGWVVAADDRKKGSHLAPFGDELSAALHVIISERDREGGYSEARDGVEVGFEYRELMDAQAYILSLGYAGHISDFSGRL